LEKPGDGHSAGSDAQEQKFIRFEPGESFVASGGRPLKNGATVGISIISESQQKNSSGAGEEHFWF